MTLDARRAGQLGGARYGSCGYPLETACLESMIRSKSMDPKSASGKVVEVCPPVRSHTEELLLQGKVDCAWVSNPGVTNAAPSPPTHPEHLYYAHDIIPVITTFLHPSLPPAPPHRASTAPVPQTTLTRAAAASQMYRTWECIRAKRAGIKLREFHPAANGVPFGYMNCVVVTREKIATEEGRASIKKVLRAASRGAEWAVADPARAAAELKKMAEGGGVSCGCGLEDVEMCAESLEMLVELGALVGENGWGRMDMLRWAMFVAWAFGPETVKALGKLPNGPDSLNLSALYTNELLPAAKAASGERDDDGGGEVGDKEDDGPSPKKAKKLGPTNDE